jgi:hypothetical protein
MIFSIVIIAARSLVAGQAHAMGNRAKLTVSEKLFSTARRHLRRTIAGKVQSRA